jgi:predicted branched-subunit amino acid permease
MSMPAESRTFSRPFLSGIGSALTSVFFLVLAGTYVGIGALAHDYGFSVWWLALSSVIVWASPAQVIAVSALGSGSPLIEAAVAVSLSGVRLFPMVVALLPLVREPKPRVAPLLLPAHFTSVSMWVESLRLLPGIARAQRLAFCNGLSVGYMSTAVTFGFVGFYLAAGVPPLLAAALLFLTPISFLMSTVRNSRQLVDRLAFALGLVIGPVLAYYSVGLDLLWTGVAGGLLAYGFHRLRRIAT